jgi:cytochrome c oxidase cbb3-type subunit 3
MEKNMSDNKIPPKIELQKGEESLLLDHNYDGIQELDHVLPRWWLWLFYATIVFAAWYSGYYLSGHGPTPQQELIVAMKEIDALKPATSDAKPDDEAELLAAFKDPAKLKHGSEVFAGKCFACHGDKGQGVVGPNLTDDNWIHGKGTLKDIEAVVTTGVPDKGMPPWGPVLTPDELRDVVIFVHSLHGTNPAGAKPPQGEKQEFKD